MFKFFIIGIIILIVVFGFLFLPRARITLDLASEPFTYDLEVRLDGKTDLILPELGSIPARIIKMTRDSEKNLPHGFVTHSELRDASREEILIFKEKDLFEYVAKILEPILEELGKVAKTEASQIRWQVRDLNLAQSYAKLKVHVEKTVYPRLDFEGIKKVLAGKSKREIKEYLENLPGVQAAEVKFWPSFLKKAPQAVGVDIL